MMLLSSTGHTAILSLAATAALSLLAGCGRPAPVAEQAAVELSAQQVDELVRHSYQYVAMYNVNNKFALKQGGWNHVVADTALKDHTMTDIARPDNDTLYVAALLDLRTEPVVLDLPAFDSDYVSLMITGYDHYVNIPMSTRVGDFRKPERMLVFSARTGHYDGQSIEGVSRRFEATGDFVSAVLRVMPHANDPARFERIREQMKRVAAVPLAQYLGGTPLPADPVTSRDLSMKMFLTKGNIDLDTLLNQSVLGPIGMPAMEAVYPSFGTADGSVMNAMHDYVIRMSADELPPAGAFWSATLYDLKNGFFIPDERKKYSVGKNAGMKLGANGGIEIYIAAEQPPGVPEENWLPIVRRDEDLGVISACVASFRPPASAGRRCPACRASRCRAGRWSRSGRRSASSSAGRGSGDPS
jgi:hypothetical protein